MIYLLHCPAVTICYDAAARTLLVSREDSLAVPSRRMTAETFSLASAHTLRCSLLNENFRLLTLEDDGCYILRIVLPHEVVMQVGVRVCGERATPFAQAGIGYIHDHHLIAVDLPGVEYAQ
jgi:hypothetical protein